MSELCHGFIHAGYDQTQQKALFDMLEKKRSVYPGINVELSGNVALHAEGCAIGSIITDLGPKAKISKIYLQGGMRPGAEDCTCCGKCRQMVAEFSTERTQVVTVSEDRILPAMTRDQLLPGSFAKLT